MQPPGPDLPATDGPQIGRRRPRHSGEPCPRDPSPCSSRPSVGDRGPSPKSKLSSQKRVSSRRPVGLGGPSSQVQGSGGGRGRGAPPLRLSRVVGSGVPSLSQLRRAGRRLESRPARPAVRPGPAGPRGPRQGAASLRAVRSSGSRRRPGCRSSSGPASLAPARPPVLRSLQGHRSVRPSSRHSSTPNRYPGRIIASSVPATASLSPAPGPAPAATRGRGLAGRVGRAAADRAGIKGQPREQQVAPRLTLQAARSR